MRLKNNPQIPPPNGKKLMRTKALNIRISKQADSPTSGGEHGGEVIENTRLATPTNPQNRHTLPYAQGESQVLIEEMLEAVGKVVGLQNHHGILVKEIWGNPHRLGKIGTMQD